MWPLAEQVFNSEADALDQGSAERLQIASARHAEYYTCLLLANSPRAMDTVVNQVVSKVLKRKVGLNTSTDRGRPTTPTHTQTLPLESPSGETRVARETAL